MNNRFKSFAFMLSLTLLIGVFGFWLHVNASEPIHLNIDNYPKIPVPDEFDQDGLKDGFFDLDCLAGGTCAFGVGDFMAILIGFLYYASLWVAGFIAFISLVYAGFMYILSGANPGNRNLAKERVTSVVMGTIILFVAVIAFTIINPDINRLKISGQNQINPGIAQYPPTEASYCSSEGVLLPPNQLSAVAKVVCENGHKEELTDNDGDDRDQTAGYIVNYLEIGYEDCGDGDVAAVQAKLNDGSIPECS